MKSQSPEPAWNKGLNPVGTLIRPIVTWLVIIVLISLGGFWFNWAWRLVLGLVGLTLLAVFPLVLLKGKKVLFPEGLNYKKEDWLYWQSPQVINTVAALFSLAGIALIAWAIAG